MEVNDVYKLNLNSVERFLLEEIAKLRTELREIEFRLKCIDERIPLWYSE